MTTEQTPALETCREWVEETMNRCGKPAVVVIWGKLFPPEALGPKCEEHAANHLPPIYARSQWAVFDLRGLVREQPS